MKHPPIVLIEWVDAATATSSWDDREQTIKDGTLFATDPIAATGFLLALTDDVVIVAATLNHHSDHVGHALAIPRAAVRRIITLRPAKGWDVAAND